MKIMWFDDNMYDALKKKNYAMLYPVVVCCIFLFPAIFFLQTDASRRGIALFSVTSEMGKSYL